MEGVAWWDLRVHGHGPPSTAGGGLTIPDIVLLRDRPPPLFELLVLLTLRRSPVLDDVLPLSLARQLLVRSFSPSSLSSSQNPLFAYMPLTGAPLCSASRWAAAADGARGRAGEERALASSLIGVRGGAWPMLGECPWPRLGV
jgi:hypothetical protein